MSDNVATFSILRADAPDFEHQPYEPFNVAIYNNGIPSMTLVDEKGVSDILHGVDDLIEQYPPNAEEAFEIELAEHFVEEMAFLALLEERDYAARNGFTHFQKRWEVRRAMGPTGRPKPAMHLVVPVSHKAKSSNLRSLVVSSHRDHMQICHKVSLKDAKQRLPAPRNVNMTTLKQPKSIQQPRKLN